MHAFAAAPIGIAPRVRWPGVRLGPLAALLFLTFGLLFSAEADARLFHRAMRTEPFFMPAQEEISPCAAQPGYPPGSLGDLFSRPGLVGGFAAGFLGAGVFGLLFGHGLVGELSGAPSILGLIFQFGLLLTFGWLIWAWWRADKSAAGAELSPRQLADAYGRDRDPVLPGLNGDANHKHDGNGENPLSGEAQLPL